MNTPGAIHTGVLDGVGIGYGPIWLFEEALKTGQVQLVLRDHVGPAVPIDIVYSARRLLPRRARVFMDYIAEEFANMPILQDGALARVGRASTQLRKPKARKQLRARE